MIPQFNIDGRGGEYLRTRALEDKIAMFLGVKHCIMTTSGFAAIFLATKVLGWKYAKVPALTMVATATATELAGGNPTFYDTTPFDEQQVIHVSLNGRACDIDNITTPFIEDACQSFGSKHNGRYLGTFGLIGCFSFQAYKMISSGNGGACVTNDDYLADRLRKLKNFGRLSGGDIHKELGYNFKFNDILADVLLAQMDDIEERIEQKKWMYYEYQRRIPQYMIPHEGTPWMVDIYTNKRDDMMRWLALNGIQTRPMYPLVPHQPFIRDMGEYPHSKRLSDTGLWIPSSPGITIEEIEEVSKIINEFN
jgi:perosamine synthetase